MPKKIYVLFIIIGILSMFFTFFNHNTKTTSLSETAFMEGLQTTPSAMLIDVRTPEEYAQGHIANAINIDFYNPSFEKEIKALDPQKTYFIYCHSGNRSRQAVQIFTQNGILSVFDLEGGIASHPNLIQE